MMRRIRSPLWLLLCFAFTASCANTQSQHSMLSGAYPARSEDCHIDVFRDSGPEKPFIKISRLDVHMEKTHFRRSNFESALPELKKQACLSGAQAIIDIDEKSSGHIETKSYHVTATGIVYR